MDLHFLLKIIQLIVCTANLVYADNFVESLFSNASLYRNNTYVSKDIENVKNVFVKPDLRSSMKKMVDLQDMVKKIQNQMTVMVKNMGDGSENYNIIKDRIKTLETELEMVNTNLDGENRYLSQNYAKYENVIANITSLHNNLSAQWENLQKILKQTELEYKSTKLLDQCVEAIKSHNFKEAHNKIRLIEDDSKINYIVKEVYNYQIANFELVLNFGYSITDNQKKKYMVYNALNYEMQSNGHRDPFKLLKFLETVREDFKNPSSNLQGEVNVLIDNIIRIFIDEVKEIFRESLIQNTYTSSIIQKLADKTYYISYDLYKNLLKDIVDYVFNFVESIKLIHFIHTHHHAEQRIAGYKVLFEKMKTKNLLDNSEIIKLAYYMKETMKMSNYSKIHPEISQEFKNLKNSLPKSVRSAIFSGVVAIKNVQFNEYLYAAECCRYDHFRRRVFTWVPDDKFGCNWVMEYVGDNFYLRHIVFEEYLYTPLNEFSYDKERRNVFTWSKDLERWKQTAQALWKIESSGDNCYIKSNFFNEYLYSAYDNLKYDSQRRRVFTWKDSHLKRFKEALWQIEPCWCSCDNC